MFRRFFIKTKPIPLGRWNTGKSVNTCMKIVDMANYDYSVTTKFETPFVFWLEQWKKVGYPKSWCNTSHLTDIIKEYGLNNLLVAKEESLITIVDQCGDDIDIREFDTKYDDPLITIEFDANTIVKFFHFIKR